MDSKNLRVFSKLINSLQILNDLVQLNKLPKKAKKQQNDMLAEAQQNTKFQSILLRKKALSFLSLNTILAEFSNFTSIKKNLKHKDQSFFLIFPNIITDYIQNQIKNPKNLKNQFFNHSLQVGLLKFIIILLTYHMGFEQNRKSIKNIVGFKIECSGR